MQVTPESLLVTGVFSSLGGAPPAPSFEQLVGFDCVGRTNIAAISQESSDRARQILGIMRDFVARRVKLVDSLKP